MPKKLKTFWMLVKQAGISWNQNNPWAQSATIAYYALFSLPSLLVIVVSTAGYFFGNEAVQGKLTQQIGRYIGTNAANAIETMIANVALTESSTIMVIFGLGVLIFGATGVFFHLKMSLNNIWNVAAKKNTFMRMILDRALSFGMVLVLGFLLLISLIVTAIMNVFSEYLTSFAPQFTLLMLRIFNFIISFFVITSLFAAIFKLLPDVKLKWKTTYLAASLTTVLFMIGTYLLAYYFKVTNPASVFGGASAVVLLLLWIYYSCLILFYGMEFTMQYAVYKQEEIAPNEYAEPAIYQKLERIKKKKVLPLDQERILKMFRQESGKDSFSK